MSYREEKIFFTQGQPLTALINYKPNETCMVETHWHDYYELLYIVDGNCTQEINTNSYDCAPGDVVLIKPGDLHATYSVEETGCMIIVILFFSEIFSSNASLYNKNFTEFTNLFRFDSVVLNSPYQYEREIERIASFLNKEFTMRESGYELVTRGYLYEFIGYIKRNLESTEVRVSYPKSKVQEICLYINENLLDVTLNKVACKFNYSKEHLSRLFKQSTGRNFKEYVSWVKVMEAKRLLLAGEHSVKEISEKLGYSDGASFYRAFKRETGLSPTQFSSMIANKGC